MAKIMSLDDQQEYAELELLNARAERRVMERQLRDAMTDALYAQCARENDRAQQQKTLDGMVNLVGGAACVAVVIAALTASPWALCIMPVAVLLWLGVKA